MRNVLVKNILGECNFFQINDLKKIVLATLKNHNITCNVELLVIIILYLTISSINCYVCIDIYINNVMLNHVYQYTKCI